MKKTWFTTEDIYNKILDTWIEESHKEFEDTFDRKPNISSEEDVIWVANKINSKKKKYFK